MAIKAYIVRARTDLPAGAIQITDLQPNTSQRNLIYQPVGQSGYCPPYLQNDTVAVVANVTTKAFLGLAAYLIDNVADGVTSFAITAALANASAAAMITSFLVNGNDVTETTATAALVAGGCGAGTKLVDAGGAGKSCGSIEEVVRILAGEVYTVPAGRAVNPAAPFNGSAAGSFDAAAALARGVRPIYATGALQISCGEGVLSGLGASTFVYAGAAGAAVRVYMYDGTLINGW